MHKKLPRQLLLAGLAALAANGAVADSSSAGCETVGNAQAICGFPAPEDIDVLPDGKHLLLSPFGGLGAEHPQPLYLFDIESLSAAPIAYVEETNPARWDDSLCPSNPGTPFAAHGIDIAQRQDGLWQLLAVNHQRESIEMFEIVEQQGGPALAWRGCVVMPEDSALNDVAALPGGGFLTSHMVTLGDLDMMEAMTLKGDTGHLWRWLPGQAVDKLPGSDSNLTNGVAVSSDGRHVFIAESGEGRVLKIDYQTGEKLGAVDAFPDNFSWAPDGRLLVTGISGALPDTCMTSPGPCLAPFQVRAIDPDTLETTILHEQAGPPMGAGTVGVVVGDYLYVGSFIGNQLLRVDLAADNRR
ncbi:MAG: SMP-30/gluconolactonase/LRE family protein [Porticoccaceae bacterium]